jgi:phytanoyl-CoA hydroxylase
MIQTQRLGRFDDDGYAIVRGMVPSDVRSRMLAVARAHLAGHVEPLEYEADTQYPGAPESRDAPGGRTVRRLLQAYARDSVFSGWATSREVRNRLTVLLGEKIELSQAHHNCVMTKSPSYSSVTNWHRDIRYWSFERPELVSVWIALGEERVGNGCLRVLPRTHAIHFGGDQLDRAQFLRTDFEDNRSLLASEVAVELDPGDVLFFHCRLFHAAGRNTTSETKFSVVFTYHAADNRPVPGSRSASLPDVPL